ncbi:hypothetical protein [Pseudoxanthomonas sp.]|uniref:hypothetical protein n=1 Tax=Pseudoxanthomonas sp. TaxID=1871049 RepID=UPI0026100BD8|nr:hypothetical protein [Pseudoxanthomonas sp.]WDS34981.1 MAG: hypothetical protein O8I58_11400 [Pseudoxanthomonas sp.]
MPRIITLVLLGFGYSCAAMAGEPPANAFWNTQKTAAITAVPASSGTRLTAYLKQRDGHFLEVDVSAVEGGNFGKSGTDRRDADRFETLPIAWLPRDDGLFQVEIRTRAWKAGKRFTVTEPLLLRPDGVVLWR